MKRVSFLIACQFVFCLFIFSGCTNKQTKNNNEIMYKDKVLSLDMTKDDIDNLLGNGTLEKEDHSNGISSYVYSYDEILKIRYYSNNDILNISSFIWTSSKIYSYTGVTVGENIKKLDNLRHETDNVEGGKKYSIYFYSNNEVVESGEDKYTIAESKQTFFYDNKNQITEIAIAKATDK